MTDDLSRRADTEVAPRLPDGRGEERAALARLRRWGGERLVREMAELYLAQMPERVAAARLAVSCHDASALGRAAHGMRSSSAQLGATALARACEAMEACAEAGDLDRAAEHFGRVRHEYAAFREWLSAITLAELDEDSPSAERTP